VAGIGRGEAVWGGGFEWVRFFAVLRMTTRFGAWGRAAGGRGWIWARALCLWCGGGGEVEEVGLEGVEADEEAGVG
jgi:hypothetical protein